MTKKIEWYQEVLSLEPGSKVFFALAKLFVDTDQLESAAATLRQGLDRHPDFLEARLLLAQVLTRLGRPGEAVQAVEPVSRALSAYPDFWRLWAQSAVGQRRDFAVYLMLVASHFTDKPIQWMDVVLEGVNSLSSRLVGPPPAQTAVPPQAPAARPAPVEPGPEAEEPAQGFRLSEAGSLRTRTMADLLASQGDFAGARDIYQELWQGAGPGPEREDLSARIKKMDAGLADAVGSVAAGAAPEDSFSRHAKNRLISTLETLAARFEARVRA
ncbi:MAG TPA: tetratricopeptide repeat-containing protein [Desulfovibrio sp.]|jgi:tetratricopeptide (TPR) repeat protein|nr:tetratricopeptide repeat-containing protein [Desulfovibrio sp.]